MAGVLMACCFWGKEHHFQGKRQEFAPVTANPRRNSTATDLCSRQAFSEAFCQAGGESGPLVSAADQGFQIGKEFRIGLGGAGRILDADACQAKSR